MSIKRYIKEVIKEIIIEPDFFSRLRELKRCNENRLILIGTPAHGNLGDHAIAVSELQFLNDYFDKESIIEISMPLYNISKRILRRYIRPEDIILVSGGGWMGSLWLHNEITIREIVSSYSKNNIIILPQTIYYEDSEEGMCEARITKDVFNRADKLKVFVRDKNSIEQANTLLGMRVNENLFFCADMVLYGTLTNCIEKKFNDRKSALLCIRNDIEKKYNLSSIEMLLQSQNYVVNRISTVRPKFISQRQRNKELVCLLNQYNNADVIVTDRLHAMIFAVLTGITCYAFNNVTKKVFGVGEYLTAYNVHLVEDISELKTIKIDSKKIYKKSEYIALGFDNLAKEIKACRG